MSDAFSLQSFPSFSALRSVAPSLATAVAAGDFCYSLDWFENLAEFGIAPKAQLELLLVVAPDGTPLFCLPLIDGPALTSLSNYYSSLYGPIGDSSGFSPQRWQAIGRHLQADRRRWPIIRLQPLDQEHPFCRNFSAALAGAGYWVDSFHCFGNWTLDVAGRSFEQYFATLPGRLQNTIRRARRKLERAGGWQLSLHATADAQLATAIAQFEAIYGESWKEAEAFPRFIPQLCHLAAARGWLRLGVLHLDGQAIAAQLWLVKDGKASIFKLAYRQGFEAFSPGSVLTAEMMRQAIDVDQVNEVDYLSGDDAYKQDWMSHRRERQGIVAFRPDTLTGLLAAARHFLGKQLRRWKAH